MITSFFSPKRKAASGTPESGVSEPSAPAAAAAVPVSSASSSDTTGKSDPKRRKVDDPRSAQKKLPQNVQDLVSHLTEDSWKDALNSHISKPSFSSLATFVAEERARSNYIYPPPADVFTALNLVPLHKVRVVIVGQDPYHQPGQGHGLAFSVRKGIKIPPSLRNIYKEIIANDCGLEKMPTHGFLERWASQGVLMLNAVLTVRKDQPNSHAKKGWEEFTDEVIRLLVKSRSDSDASGLVFLLWGKPASKKAETIINKFNFMSGGKKKHVVICSSHPSPLGATKTKAPFIGSKCFTRANSALTKMGLDQIHWGVD